jgi:hypothetical protein
VTRRRFADGWMSLSDEEDDSSPELGFVVDLERLKGFVRSGVGRETTNEVGQ